MPAEDMPAGTAPAIGNRVAEANVVLAPQVAPPLSSVFPGAARAQGANAVLANAGPPRPADQDPPPFADPALPVPQAVAVQRANQAAAQAQAAAGRAQAAQMADQNERLLRVRAASDRFGPAASELAARSTRRTVELQQSRLPLSYFNEGRRAWLRGLHPNGWQNGFEIFAEQQARMAEGRTRFGIDQAGSAYNLQQRIAVANAHGGRRADFGTTQSSMMRNLQAAQGYRSTGDGKSGSGNSASETLRMFRSRLFRDRQEIPGSLERFADGGVVGGGPGVADLRGPGVLRRHQHSRGERCL